MLDRKKMPATILKKFISTISKSEIHLTKSEKKLFNHDKKIISKINHWLSILHKASILTEEIRQKTIELFHLEQHHHSSFGFVHSNLEDLKENNQLTASNVKAFLIYNHFHHILYNSCSTNLILLVKLNISTHENRRIAVRIGDMYHIIPEFLLFLNNHHIILNESVCFDLEEIFLESWGTLDLMIKKLKNFINNATEPTLENFQKFLQLIRIEKTLDRLPHMLSNEVNIQLVHLYCKDNSMMEFFRFLTYEKIFTQSTFNDVIRFSQSLRPYVKQLKFTSDSIKALKQFAEIKRKIINIPALECMTLKQGTRIPGTFFHKIPQDLIPEIMKFLIPFPDKKTKTIFADKIDNFHASWATKKKI